MTEEQYANLYFRDVELNLVAFKRVLDCEEQIRALAQIAYDIGHSAASLGEPRTVIDGWDKMPTRYIQVADAHQLTSRPGNERGVK
jgi:hypothetical protein